MARSRDWRGLYVAEVPGLTEKNCCVVQEGVGEDLEVMFVGCLPVEIDFAEQEVGSISLWR